MKIASINFSGNVGKTLVAKNLVAPKLLGSRRITIETINSGGEGADAEIKAAQFTDLAVELMTLDDDEHLVVDIGASNVEAVVTKLKSMKSAATAIDHFMLPTTPDPKAQLDTINTALALAELGVKPAQIHVLMNKVVDIDFMPGTFASVYAGSPAHFQLCQVPILENEVYARITGDKRSVHEIAGETDDLKAAIKLETDKSKKMEISQRLVTRMLAKGAVENLDEVWAALNISV